MTVIGEWFFLPLSWVFHYFLSPVCLRRSPLKGLWVGIWHPARASPPKSNKCQVCISIFTGSFHFSAKTALTIKLKGLDLYCCNIPQTNFRKWKSPKPLLSLQINSTDKFNKYNVNDIFNVWEDEIGLLGYLRAAVFWGCSHLIGFIPACYYNHRRCLFRTMHTREKKAAHPVEKWSWDTALLPGNHSHHGVVQSKQIPFRSQDKI